MTPDGRSVAFIFHVHHGEYRGTLYAGVTNDLARRVAEHRLQASAGFSAAYNVNRLVYFEMANDVRSAIAREKQIKGWIRAKKVALIEGMNPYWEDLAPKLE